MNKNFLFVGEERSPTAIRMGVTWKDKRLAAAHLSKAVEALGIPWDECMFLNVYEDDIEDIRSFDGIVVAMGRKVEKELKKHLIPHEYIHHPAARGKIRIIENYKAHVREQLGHIINAIECDYIDTLGDVTIQKLRRNKIWGEEIGIA